MATDEEYSAFLEKANESSSSAPATKSNTTSKSKKDDLVTSSQGLPEELSAQSLGEVYFSSETDEPWEGVSLAFEGETLDADSFAKTLGVKADDVEELHEHSKGEISTNDVSDLNVKVAKAGQSKKEDVKSFRVEKGRSRVEYFLVVLRKSEGRVVGVRAKAVES